MTDPRPIDLERLAALLDGRLSRAEAAALRQELAEAPDDVLEAHADAAVISRELAAGSAESLDMRAPRSSRHDARRWLMPALAAAGVVGIAVLLLRPPSGARGTDNLDGMGGPSSIAASLPLRPFAPPEWSAVRTGDLVVSERGRAVRIGATLVDHALATRRRDTAAVRRLAGELAMLVDGVPGGSAIASRWRNETGSGSAGTTLAPATVAMVDSTFVQIGVWLEGARLALDGGWQQWLADHPPVPLRRALSLPTLPEKDRAILTRVLRLARDDTDAGALAGALTSAETELGR